LHQRELGSGALTLCFGKRDWAAVAVEKRQRNRETKSGENSRL